MDDTIAAIASGSSVSAIGIARISGSAAITVADSVFRADTGLRLTDAQSKRMYYGELIGIDGNIIDMCLCFISRGPNSYTGEDTAEFHCHGSPVVLSEVLRTVFACGVRLALPGEFTKRAFLNGRMDLAQAEAVIDLIESETPWAAKNAAGQLRGAVSARLENVYSSLLDVIAHFHAVIDYPDEDIDDFQMQSHLSALRSADEELAKMLATHERGRVLRDGVPTVIVGRPNTGKSSLLNALLGYNRAIVTDIPGTTRDTIEEKLLVGGVLLRLVDTAGLRKAHDAVETLGIEHTHSAIDRAKLAILVIDGSEPLQNDDFEAYNSIPPDMPRLIAVNKSDLPSALSPSDVKGFAAEFCHISVLTGYGLDALETVIRRLLHEPSEPPVGEIITNARQAEAIRRSMDGIKNAIFAIEQSVTPDAVLTDVEAALTAIGEITGRTIREDVTDRIFERFCVGK